MENYILLGVFLLVISIGMLAAEGIRKVYVGFVNRKIKKNLSKVYPPINMSLK